jgi:putative transposase
MEAARRLSEKVGAAEACRALGVARSSFYRGRTLRVIPQGRHSSPRALSLQEKARVLDVLHSERFVDMAPREVYATLLDEGTYLCSISTMYRILAQHGEVRERRNQLRHPSYHKPELLARGPNEVWSWDITKLKGPMKWVYFYLYVILDIFSRYVVGWMGGSPGVGPPGQSADRGDLQKTGYCGGSVDHPCGSWQFHEGKDCCATAGRSGGDQHPQPALLLHR